MGLVLGGTSSGWPSMVDGVDFGEGWWRCWWGCIVLDPPSLPPTLPLPICSKTLAAVGNHKWRC